MAKPIQIQRRLKKITQPNDKLTSEIMIISPDQFAAALERHDRYSGGIYENKKRGIITDFKITIKDNRACEPPDMFDKAVLSVCVSELSAKNNSVTVDRIFRGLTGGKAHRGTRMTSGMKSAIVSSVEKMMAMLIEIDATNAAAKMNYPDMPTKVVSAILPAAYEERIVNGQPVTTIHFFKDSPLMIFARTKNQILTYDTRLLDVANLNNTRRVVALKFYVVERVMEIVGHNMTPTITFADVFKKCGLVEGTKKQKQEARRTIEAVLNHLKAEGVIDDFRFERGGNEYRTIKIKYSSQT